VDSFLREFSRAFYDLPFDEITEALEAIVAKLGKQLGVDAAQVARNDPDELWRWREQLQEWIADPALRDGGLFVAPAGSFAQARLGYPAYRAMLALLGLRSVQTAQIAA
jgi:hypothetical protein